MGYNLNPEKNANLLMIIPWETFLADSNPKCDNLLTISTRI